MKCVVCNKPFSLAANCIRKDCPRGNLETVGMDSRYVRAWERFKRDMERLTDYELQLAEEREASTARTRMALAVGFGLGVVITVLMLIAFHSPAKAFDHGFSDLPQPHSPEMQWVETRMMPGPQPRRSGCCGKGDLYYADVYKRNPDGSYDAEITDGSAITYPDGDHRVPLANGTKFHIPADRVNPPEDGNALGHGVVFLGVDQTGEVNRVANVWCFFPIPEGS